MGQLSSGDIQAGGESHSVGKVWDLQKKQQGKLQK